MTDEECACRVIVRGPLHAIRHCAAHAAGPDAVRRLALAEAEAAWLRADRDSLLRQVGAAVAEVRSLRASLLIAGDLLAERRAVAEALAIELAAALEGRR